MNSSSRNQSEKHNPFITGSPEDFSQEISEAVRQKLSQRATYKSITVRSNLRPVEQVVDRVLFAADGDIGTGTIREIRVERDSTGSRVILWEKHDKHPNGEVFIAGDKPVRVAETPKVLEKIWTGFLPTVKALSKH